MTTPAPTDQNAATSVSHVGVLTKLIGILKGMPEAALKDIEQIESGIDGHKESHMMPTPKESPTGPGQSMRGFAASSEVDKHSDLWSQTGITRMYEEFDRRMGETMKAVSTLATHVKAISEGIQTAQKAAQEEADKETAKAAADEVARKAAEEQANSVTTKAAAKDTAMEGAVRKARVAVRKAEDMSDDEDENKESCEKAADALKTLAETIGKAEEEVEDDADEKRTEKARGELRTLKGKLKTAVEKSSKIDKTHMGGTSADVPGQQKRPPAHDAMKAEIEAFAAAKGLTMQQVFEGFGVAKPDANGNVITAPPVFAKAVSADSGLTIEILGRRIEDAVEKGELSPSESLKADTLKSRFGAVRAGRHDTEAFVREVGLAPLAVQALFNPVQAAA